MHEDGRKRHRDADSSEPRSSTPGTPPQQLTGARGRRITKACARCRKRKIKCDFHFPTCGACALARAECLGFDAVRGAERPRSTISHLENQIAQLEIELARVKSEHSSNARGAASAAAERLTARLARTIGEPWGPDLDQDQEASFLSLASPTFLSQSPLPSFGSDQLQRPADSPVDERTRKNTPISSMSHHVIVIMLKNYCNIYLPQYPVVKEADLLKSCDKIYTRDNPSDFDFFIVAITLAISANTLISQDEKRAANVAENFWGIAVEHLDHIGRTSSWERLQALQLLAHYGLLNPRVVNCNSCASAATRLCLQLGLHRELSAKEQAGLSPQLLEMRRRLFWTSYSIDAALHSVLCQPLVWPSAAITAKFPDSEKETSPMAHVWSLRQVETEVAIKMYFPPKEQGPDYSFHHWFSTLHGRLAQWNKNAKRGLADTINLQIFRLNRPTPRVPNPTAEMRKRALISMIILITEYAEMEKSGKFFYLWYAAHYLTELGASLLESIIVGLEGSRQGPTHLDGLDLAVLVKTVRTFPLLLGKVASSWPDIQRTASALEQIASPVLQNLTENLNGKTMSTHDYTQAKHKLAGYLCPLEEQNAKSQKAFLDEQNHSLHHNLDVLAEASEHYDMVDTAVHRNLGPASEAKRWIPRPLDALDITSDPPAIHPAMPSVDSAWSPNQPLSSVPEHVYSYTTGMWYGPGADVLWDSAGLDSEKIFAALLRENDVDKIPT